MFNSKQFRQLVIRPTLEYLHPTIPYSKEAEDLLFMTAAHESNLGAYLKQIGGPALGIYQMEPATHGDIWDSYLRYKGTIHSLIVDLDSPSELDLGVDNDAHSMLVYNLAYATAMARVHYWRVAEPLPRRIDFSTHAQYLIALGKYAKKYYNTEKGKATAQDYTDAFLNCGGRDAA